MLCYLITNNFQDIKEGIIHIIACNFKSNIGAKLRHGIIPRVNKLKKKDKEAAITV